MNLAENTSKRFKFLKDIRFLFSSIIILGFIILSIFTDALALHNPEFVELELRLAPPSSKYPLGCDLFGRDLWTLIVYGARQTFIIILATVTLSTFIGTFLGLIAGYFRGFLDTLIMRIVDILMAFPGILLAMSLSAFLGPSIKNVIFAISATGWTSIARLVRGQVMSLREREYVLASHSMGAKSWRILLHHILPFLWTPLFVTCTFALSGVILVEASLSFLGLGANTNIPTWGGLLHQGRSVLNEAPFLSIIPGLLIASAILAFNFMGDTLRDFFDPKGS